MACRECYIPKIGFGIELHCVYEEFSALSISTRLLKQKPGVGGGRGLMRGTYITQVLGQIMIYRKCIVLLLLVHQYHQLAKLVAHTCHLTTQQIAGGSLV